MAISQQCESHEAFGEARLAGVEKDGEADVEVFDEKNAFHDPDAFGDYGDLLCGDASCAGQTHGFANADEPKIIGGDARTPDEPI